MANGNGTGQGGKSFEDRELAGRVRRLSLAKIEKELKKGKGKLYEALLIKLAGTVLPRLNEHTGADGAELPTPIIQLSTIASE
jgi:hypothetical protein